MTKRLALLALICLSCGSSKRSVIVVSLSYDATVMNPEAIKNLQVTVEGVVKNYPVPASAPFQDCTSAAPCTLEIDTERPGRLDIAIAGTGEIPDGGLVVIGTGSGSAMADPNKVQTVSIELSCASGGCGIVSGNDGGAGAGGSGGSGAGRGGAGGGAGGTPGAGGSVGGTSGAGGSAGSGGSAGGSGTGGIAGGAGTGGGSGAGGNAGAAGTAGGSGSAGTAGTTGTGGRGGTTGSAGSAGGGGRGGAGGTSGTGGTAGAAGAGARGGTTGSAGTTGAGGTGGAAGTAGGAGRGGAGGMPIGANCADSIKLNGYAWPPAQPCSACLDNGISQATKCESIINCVDQNYPCTGNCLTNCQNQAGANLVVLSCVNSLLNAACN